LSGPVRQLRHISERLDRREHRCARLYCAALEIGHHSDCAP
jgi:hypothetical protein